MKIALNQLDRELAKGLAPLYVLHGEEPLLKQEALEKIREAARKQGFTQRVAFVGAAKQFDWSSLLVASTSQSLFGEQQLLELRLPTGKPGTEGAQVLQKLAQQMAQSNCAQDVLLIVILPKADQIMRKAAWFAALTAASIELPIETILRRDMPVWLAQRLKAQGQYVPAGEQGAKMLNFFTDCVEGNLLAAHQEIQKLGLLYPQGELTQKQLETCIFDAARYSIQSLSEAALSGQLMRADRVLNGLLAEGVAVVPLFSILASDVLSLYRARQALDEGVPMPQALRQARAWGAKERLFERLLPKLSLFAIGKVLRSTHIVDGCIKGLKNNDWPISAEACLQRMLMQICGLCRVINKA